MFRLCIFLCLLICAGLLDTGSTSIAQEIRTTQSVLRQIADTIVQTIHFQFRDQRTGMFYHSPADAPDSAKLQPDSPYGDWRYWNGVLNVALFRLGEALHEPTYTQFPIKQLAYNFDNYQFFEKRYSGEGKWNYPFGQHFILEELDDCGAMGASVIEAYQLDPQNRYRAYIDEAANHISKRQSRLKDSTLVRSFPRKWTIWADDLYMSISFLARMGEFSHDRRFLDDAALQVIHFHKYLFNKEKGLMAHCWYSEVDSPGVAYWGRANGWALLAQVDLLDRLPANHPQSNIL